MERSEYLSVVVGLIVGLSLTRILMTIGASVPKQKEDKWSITHSLLLASAFILQVKYWWDLYDAKDVISSTDFWGYMMILSVPFLMFLATTVLTPELNREVSGEITKHIDYQKFLTSRRRSFYGFVMAVLLMMIAQGVFIWEDFFTNTIAYAIRGGVLLIVLFFHWIKNDQIQFILALFLLVALVGYTCMNDAGGIGIPTLKIPVSS
ncbi:MAG: hypothetical protein AAF191_05775 [Verrucomicrobiota bacterium]